jgi:hypothetical protein
MFTVKGSFGYEYRVYKVGHLWAWNDSQGYGFTHFSLKNILEYLEETKGVKI